MKKIGKNINMHNGTLYTLVSVHTISTDKDQVTSEETGWVTSQHVHYVAYQQQFNTNKHYASNSSTIKSIQMS